MTANTSVDCNSEKLQEESFSIRLIVKKVAAKLGDRLAQIISQIHYWLQKREVGETHLGSKWIYNRYLDWHEQFPWLSVWQIGRCVRQLEKLGVLVTDNFNPTKWYRRKWYQIDYERLEELTGWNPLKSPIVQNCTIEDANLHNLHILHTSPQQQQQREEKEESRNDDKGKSTSVTPPDQNNPEAIAIESKLAQEGLLSGVLLKLSLQFTLGEIEKAIALCQERGRTGKVQSRKGMFRRCLEGAWWREEVNREVTPVQPVPEDFPEWFVLAKKSKVVVDRTNNVERLFTFNGSPLVTIAAWWNKEASGLDAEVALPAGEAMQRIPMEVLEDICTSFESS